MTNYYDVGKLTNTHGLRGEVKIIPTTDFVEERFQKGQQLLLGDSKQKLVVTIQIVRQQKNFLLVTFKEFTDINQVEQYKGQMLYVTEDDLHPLEDNSYYYHDIIGLTVIDEATGQNYGTVTEILTPGANDVWVVDEGHGKTFLLPFIQQVVKKVDLDQKQVLVELMDGLRDED